jgi:hypothetical protein
MNSEPNALVKISRSEVRVIHYLSLKVGVAIMGGMETDPVIL